MSQSLSSVIIHLIFSTKNREPFIVSEFRPRLHAYLAEVAKNTQCDCYIVGGTADHVHIALNLARTISIADLAKKLKVSSSQWMKSEPAKSRLFAWQRGYACFSISKKDLGKLREYIRNQEEHHRRRTFQEELRAFFEKYEIEYDEEYVWD